MTQDNNPNSTRLTVNEKSEQSEKKLGSIDESLYDTSGNNIGQVEFEVEHDSEFAEILREHGFSIPQTD